MPHRLPSTTFLVLSFLSLLLPVALATPLHAQGPDLEWRTMETARYRVHYPAPAEEWARHLAQRLEAVRDRVEPLVGYAGDETVDVVVADPVAQANGFVLPFPGFPRMVLWTTPPAAGGVIGHFHDWPELLLIHEQTHLSHLLRPSRSPWQRRLASLMPLPPIVRKAPRWAIEGYATVIEGRLTGAGRPHGALRAAVLRQWARGGRLPSYGRLSSDDRSFLGMSMAYLAGSAFLEWLEEREGPGSLPALWARLTARQGRSFDDAFTGVFGQPPGALWGRFSAELTHDAVALELLLEPLARQGEPWLDLTWATGAPAVSPDGERLALVEGHRERPPRVAVYATAPDEAAAAERARRREEILERDPEDVLAVERGPLPRQPLATLDVAEGVVGDVRWLPDGRLLVPRTVRDADGLLRWDLFLWDSDGGAVERLTRQTDLVAADPAPDGDWAVAVRSRWGASGLVRVDLASGEVTPWGEPRVDVVVEAPRVSPAGDRVAFLRHRAGRRELVVRQVAAGDERVVPTPEATFLAAPAWRAGGDFLYLAVGEDGLIDIQALPVSGEGERHQVTRGVGAALAPAPTPDTRGLYYLALDADGYDVRFLDLDAATLQRDRLELPADLFPALPPPAAGTEPLALAPPPPSRPYGWGRAERAWLTGGQEAPSGSSFELALRLGDVIGRWEALVAAAAGGDGAPTGAAASFAWRGHRAPVVATLYALEELPSRQDAPPVAGGTALDEERLGLDFGARWQRHLPRGRWGLEGNLGWARVEPAGAAADDEGAVRLALFGEQRFGRGGWRAALAGGLEGYAARGHRDHDGGRGRFETRLGYDAWGVRLAVDAAESRGDEGLGGLVRVGGMPSTLRPPTAAFGRIFEPALPVGSLLGDSHRGYEIAVEGFPVTPFWRRHRVEGAGEAGSLDLAGLEFALEIPALPLARLPAAELSAGVARLLDPPFEGKTRAWIGIAWRP